MKTKDKYERVPQLMGRVEVAALRGHWETERSFLVMLTVVFQTVF